MKRTCFVSIIMTILCFLCENSNGDTINLTNGRSIEGIVKKETEGRIELDLGFGTVTFFKSEIAGIDRSSPIKKELIRKRWEKEKIESAEREAKIKKEIEEEMKKKDYEPKEVKFEERLDSIVVNARLNRKVEASLVLDTGASLILLSNDIAKKLRLEDSEGQAIEVSMADGRAIKAKYIYLESVSIEGVRLENVPAAVLMEGDVRIGSYDGLLGMSFLSKFNFEIDNIRKKLILNRRR